MCDLESGKTSQADGTPKKLDDQAPPGNVATKLEALHSLCRVAQHCRITVHPPSYPDVETPGASFRTFREPELCYVDCAVWACAAC